MGRRIVGRKVDLEPLAEEEINPGPAASRGGPTGPSTPSHPSHARWRHVDEPTVTLTTGPSRRGCAPRASYGSAMSGRNLGSKSIDNTGRLDYILPYNLNEISICPPLNIGLQSHSTPALVASAGVSLCALAHLIPFMFTLSNYTLEVDPYRPVEYNVSHSPATLRRALQHDV